MTREEIVLELEKMTDEELDEVGAFIYISKLEEYVDRFLAEKDELEERCDDKSLYICDRSEAQAKFSNGQLLVGMLDAARE